MVSSGWFLRGPLRALLQDLGCSLPRCSREQQQLCLVALVGPWWPRRVPGGPGRAVWVRRGRAGVQRSRLPWERGDTALSPQLFPASLPL